MATAADVIDLIIALLAEGKDPITTVNAVAELVATVE